MNDTTKLTQEYDNSKALEIYGLIKAKTGLSQKDVAEKAGINNPHLSNILNGKRELTHEMESRLKDAFPEIFGSICGIPFYNTDVITHIENVFGLTKIEPESIVVHPMNLDYSLWTTSSDDAMSPLINKGDMITLKKIDMKEIVFGKVYFIVTKYENYIRKIRIGSNVDKFTIVPENKNDYDQQEIDISSVVAVYRVGACSRLI